MTVTGKEIAGAAAAIAARIRPQPPGPRITFDKGASEIADTLKIDYNAAIMTLCGLCATGNVRWVDVSGAIVEEDELTVANFSGKPALIDINDVRACLVEWSPDPQPKKRDQVIQALLAEGRKPQKNNRTKSE